MANFVRRLVSGNKARYHDDELNLDLDLVYVTDRIIIMGYPAASFEAFYRNRREDARKFLEHRHKDNYWIFNFCPIQENSYPASEFGGRVSRYPFPDHHAPPLSILPLATREIRLWLDGSSDRVAVLHCKAGKGRSGTIACAFLLSLDEDPTPPRLHRSYSASERSKIRADEWIQVVQEEGALDAVESTETEKAAEAAQENDSAGSKEEKEDSQDILPKLAQDLTAASSPATRATLESVLALHTERRMRAPASEKQKRKPGVSIPSQRRWLYYWSQILSGTAPPGFWGIIPPPSGENLKHQARIMQITVRLREPSGAKHHLVRATNALLDRTAQMKGKQTRLPGGTIWISVARYNDQFVETLERWEKHSRHESAVGRRRAKSELLEGEHLKHIFDSGEWDTAKMVRRFATFGQMKGSPERATSDKDQKVLTYNLQPLSESKWETIRKAVESEQSGPSTLTGSKDTDSVKSAVSTTPALEITSVEEGVVIDARREVRTKLYMGKIPMGWFWFIPIFHMSQDEHESHFKLTRKEVDFPLGPGDWLVDLDVKLKWEANQTRLPAKQMSTESDAV